MAVSGCFYGAPGEIRTPDLVVRSHALESALKSINKEVFLIPCSHRIQNYKEFYYYFEEFLRPLWELREELQRWVSICSTWQYLAVLKVPA